MKPVKLLFVGSVDNPTAIIYNNERFVKETNSKKDNLKIYKYLLKLLMLINKL
jgi:hypothetical protein